MAVVIRVHGTCEGGAATLDCSGEPPGTKYNGNLKRAAPPQIIICLHIQGINIPRIGSESRHTVMLTGNPVNTDTHIRYNPGNLTVISEVPLLHNRLDGAAFTTCASHGILCSTYKNVNGKVKHGYENTLCTDNGSDM